VTDPLNHATAFGYDTNHDRTSTNYTYDTGNRVTQVQEKDTSNVVTEQERGQVEVARIS
jgi:hypothetical protein